MTLLSEITSSNWQLALGKGGVVQGADSTAQCIHIVLLTPRGSVPGRPEFGSDVHLYIDRPIQQAVPHLVRETVDALRRDVPTAVVLAVTPTMRDAQLVLRVRWRDASEDEDTVGRVTEVRPAAAVETPA